ncbi:hypothetical protein NMY22_g16784 [Coprinellus aureogranulatus]|nr:hypothetical protein NMY22_g16784 [Coprinellus aureogranulatus]
MEQMEDSKFQTWPLPAQCGEHASPFRLSEEVVIHIIGYLDPSDILTMRKTSRLLNSITKSRVVWLCALERICIANEIFRPSFPVERMSILELEHAATAPSRFLNLVKRLDLDAAPLPYSSRDLVFRKAPSLEGTHGLRSFYLVPGGRFLLLSTDDLSLVLWDLGHNMNVVPKPYPIATSEKCGYLAGLRRFGDKLFVGVVSKYTTAGDSSPLHWHLRINEIDLAESADVQFRSVAELALDNRLPQTVHFTAGNMGISVLNYGSEFLVWNWMERTGCKWVTSLHLPTDKTPVLSFEEGIITLDKNGDIWSWDPPDLSPVPSVPNINQFPVVYNQPKARIPCPIVPASKVHIRGTGFSHSTPSFCLLYEDQPTPSRTLFSVLSVKRLGVQKDPLLPMAILVPGGTNGRLYGDSNILHSSALSSISTVSENLIFCSATSERALMVTVLPKPSKIEFGPITLSSKYLTLPETIHSPFHHGKLGFCPMSGRLVFVKSDGSICLRDFLLPPSEP